MLRKIPVIISLIVFFAGSAVFGAIFTVWLNSVGYFSYQELESHLSFIQQMQWAQDKATVMHSISNFSRWIVHPPMAIASSAYLISTCYLAYQTALHIKGVKS